MANIVTKFSATPEFIVKISLAVSNFSFSLLCQSLLALSLISTLRLVVRLVNSKLATTELFTVGIEGSEEG